MKAVSIDTGSMSDEDISEVDPEASSSRKRSRNGFIEIKGTTKTKDSKSNSNTSGSGILKPGGKEKRRNPSCLILEEKS